MNPWNEIFLKENATVTDTQTVVFNDTSKMTFPDDLLVIPLIGKDLLRFSGADSKKFLQGQVTCDMNQLGDNHWSAGAICNPKGRMITSFNIYPLSSDDMLMEMNPGLGDITLEAIKKYSVFFKTELNNASEQFCQIGLMGKSVKTVAEKLFNIQSQIPNTLYPYQDCLLIPLGEDRLKILLPVEKLAQLWNLCISEGRPAGSQLWKLTDIQQGIGEVSLPTANELIPQMINLQARGGISFKKGCYTGQEIVARMKYLGKLKRRMYRIQLHGERPPEIAQPCYINGSTNNQGMIISAIQNGSAIEALAVMTDQLAAEKFIGIGEQAVQAFTILPLPYNLD